MSSNPRKDDPQAVAYVPSGDHLATLLIAAGSGIVGRPDGSGRTDVYFEGGIRGQVNMSSLAERVSHAYDRMITEYPTTARMVLPDDALVAVGVFSPQEGRIELTGPDSEARVNRWLSIGHGQPE